MRYTGQRTGNFLSKQPRLAPHQLTENLHCIPSAWACGACRGVALMVGMLLIPCIGYWGIIGTVWLWKVGQQECRQVPAPLRLEGEQWTQWSNEHQRWVPVSVVSRWVGPWMMCISVNDRRYWLWPDSSSATSLWRLRKMLHVRLRKGPDIQSQIRWPFLARLRSRWLGRR